MARAKKTIAVEKVLEMINHLNANSTIDSQFRHGANSFAERILHESNAYAGFGYLEAHQVPAGQVPGCVRLADGSFVFPDESRRVYYRSRKLGARK